MKIDWRNKIWLAIFILVLGLAGGWFARKEWIQYSRSPISRSVYAIRQTDASFPLISPLLTFDFSDSVIFREFQPLKGHIEQVVKNHILKDDAVKISAYFRDLSTGHWVGINEKDSYAPASLLKVPIMIAYFEQAQTEPDVLRKKIVYEKDDAAEVEQNQSGHPLVSGQQYTVEELIKNMIVYSDNNALLLLSKNIDEKSLQNVFSDLGLQPPGNKALGQYEISAKIYSLFFRILRNATLLNRQMSEKALELLTQTTFQDGLAAGLPEGLTVAHKFGLHAIKNGEDTVGIELHDCGIIYDPQNPFLLCVMTRGDDLAKLKNIIKDVSGLVYTEVTKGK